MLGLWCDAQLDIWFCSEAQIRELNSEYRAADKSTDVLSFTMNDVSIPLPVSKVGYFLLSYIVAVAIAIAKFVSPEEFADKHMLDFEKHLGDIVISPDYVQRVCEIDRENAASHKGTDISDDNQKNIESDDNVEEEDAGVSKAMTSLFSFEERIPLLLIHSVLHLLGHDHETEEDWQRMTAREEVVMQRFSEQYHAASESNCETSDTCN